MLMPRGVLDLLHLLQYWKNGLNKASFYRKDHWEERVIDASLSGNAMFL